MITGRSSKHGFHIVSCVPTYTSLLAVRDEQFAFHASLKHWEVLSRLSHPYTLQKWYAPDSSTKYMGQYTHREPKGSILQVSLHLGHQPSLTLEHLRRQYQILNPTPPTSSPEPRGLDNNSEGFRV